MKNKIWMPIAMMVIIAASCAKKLDLVPVNSATPATVYSSADGYLSVLAKIYGGLAITGNQGPSGNPDIGGGLDEGSQVAFIRGVFNCEELPTDEAIVAWNDQTIHDFHDLKWTSSDPFLRGMYARPIYNITLMNEYLRQSTDDKLASNGISGTDADDIKKSVAEVRFLRAYNYWVMLDLFGKSTFITEDDQVGSALPREINRDSLFTYIESELLAIQNDLSAARTAVYGRVDQGADWALLARLYLNAEVYTGKARYADALSYASKVIGAGYTLHASYPQLFMADNDKCTDEIIWTINCDGLNTQAYGNTTFLVHCASGDDHDQYGVAGGWYGYRATAGLANLFSDLSGNTDKRVLFNTDKYKTNSSQIAISDVSNFDNGLHVKKFINVRSDGGPISDPTVTFADIDFPVFRLPEMHLIYIEAYLRGGGGDATTALGYLNAIRARSGTSELSGADLTLQTVLDERGRELYWEGHRRTDLIRYGLLTTGTYLWPWKGGVASGTAVDSKYNIFPIRLPTLRQTETSHKTQVIKTIIETTMKTVFKIYACLLSLCLLNACSKDENKVYLQESTAPVLTVTTGADVSYVNAALPALTLSWTNPDYTFNTGVSSLDVTYNIEIDTAADFSNPAKKVIAVSKSLSYTLTVSELNDLMLNQLQLAKNQPHTLVMRVTSNIVNNSGKLASNTTQLTAIPYSIPPKVEPPSSGTLYITGAATPGNWQCGCGEAELTSQKFTQESETLYMLPSIQLTGGQSYTFVPVYGSWSTKYSIKTKNDPNEVNGGDFQVGGEDILAPDATGNYKIEVDFQRGIFTVTKL